MKKKQRESYERQKGFNMVQWKQIARLSVSTISSAIVGVAILYLALFLSGCASNRTITEQPVLQHTAELAQLEEGIRNYGDTIKSVTADLDSVRKQAAGIAGTIDATILLFDAYQSAVKRLIQDYDTLRTAVKTEGHRGSHLIDNPSH